MRGVHTSVVVVAEEQHRCGDRELGQCQRDKSAALGQSQPRPGWVGGPGLPVSILGRQIMVKEGTAKSHASRHRVRAPLPLAAGGAADQVRGKRVRRQPRILAVDLGRDRPRGPCRISMQ